MTLKRTNPIPALSAAKHGHFVVTGAQQEDAIFRRDAQVLQLCKRTSMPGAYNRDLLDTFICHIPDVTGPSLFIGMDWKPEAAINEGDPQTNGTSASWAQKSSYGGLTFGVTYV
jgi:hypothetical protein